jgi:hypothetical protein
VQSPGGAEHGAVVVPSDDVGGDVDDEPSAGGQLEPPLVVDVARRRRQVLRSVDLDRHQPLVEVRVQGRSARSRA